MVTPGTALYRAAATLAARALAAGLPVASIHAKRSLACGEVAFGRSDVDLTLVIEEPSDLGEECALLERLAARYAAVKRVVPVLGECHVATVAELARWYASPFYAEAYYRDRGWLRLHGRAFERPRPSIAVGEGRDSLLWWYFWAWERLPRFHRAGNVRTARNLLLDMIDAYLLYVGASDRPRARAEVARAWHARRGGRCAPGVLEAAPGVDRWALLRSIYAESLVVGELLGLEVARSLEGTLPEGEVATRVPFGFAERRYLLVEVDRADRLEAALARQERDPAVVVTSERALRLYLHHRSPFEFATAAALPRPADEALDAAVARAAHRLIPRWAGFSIGRREGRGASVGARYAQCRLWAEERRVAASVAELRTLYARRFGGWPYEPPVTRAHFFARHYPEICATIDAIAPPPAPRPEEPDAPPASASRPPDRRPA